MVNKSDVIKELAIYTAFFGEDFIQISPTKSRRAWHYRWDEPSFLAGKTVFAVEPDGECFLYDYSKILTTKVDENNYRDFVNKLGLDFYKLSDFTLTKSKLKEILENNAKAANVAEKIDLQIKKRIEIDTMF